MNAFQYQVTSNLGKFRFLRNSANWHFAQTVSVETFIFFKKSDFYREKYFHILNIPVKAKKYYFLFIAIIILLLFHYYYSFTNNSFT